MNVWSILERARERWPDRPAVVDGELRSTYGELARRVEGLAAALSARGVRPQDRVAILAPNGAAYLEAYFAAAGIGAVLVPLHGRLVARELREILADAEVVAALVDGARSGAWDEATAGLDSPAATIWVGAPARPTAPGEARYEELAASGEEFAPADVPEDAVAQLYYTSGSTGRSKGVMLTHRNVCAHALAATSEFDLAEDDVWGHVAPLFHLADAWATFAITWVGGLHVTCPEFEARAVLETLAKEGVTVTNLVPTMLRRLLAVPAEDAPTPPLRLLLTGGAPIDLETVRAAIDRFGCEYVQTYGMTETSPYLTVSSLRQHHYEESPEAQLRRRARTGRPYETIELQVVDEAGRTVSWNDRDVGEIRVRGETVSPGYWRRPEETAAAFRDGWLYTGDLARIDADGYVQIVDRKKDMILTGAENVYCVEVEGVLHAHPAVIEAAVFGVPDDEWGELVCAAVALASPATQSPATQSPATQSPAKLSPAIGDELLAWCRSRLAGYKCPRRIEVLDELPKTGSGKVHKASLRAARGSAAE